MRIFLYTTLFLFGFITSGSAQTNRNFPLGQHPLLQQARAGVKDLTPFYNKDSTAFVTASVIDSKRKMLYWFNCYGYIFDSVPIADENARAITNKKLQPLNITIL